MVFVWIRGLILVVSTLLLLLIVLLLPLRFKKGLGKTICDGCFELIRESLSILSQSRCLADIADPTVMDYL